MSSLSPTIFFVGGARRSGTTWLTKMLNSHPEVLALGEGFFVGTQGWGMLPSAIDVKQFNRWAAIENVQESWLDGITPAEGLRIAKRSMVQGLMLAAAARSKKPNAAAVGDKSAYSSSRFAKDLFALFPDSVFIDIVRDGRDCIVSDAFLALRSDPAMFPAEARPHLTAARRYWILREQDADPVSLLGDGGWLCRRNAKEWGEAVRGSDEAAAMFGAVGRYVRFRYESLLTNPHEVRSAFTLLGVDDSHEVVSRCVEENRFEKLAGGRAPGQEDRGSFYRKGTAGGWEQYLSEADKSAIKELCGAELIALGYTPDNGW